MSKSTRFVKIVSPLALAIALAACGGDSSFGGGSGNTGDKTTTTNSGDSNSKATVVASSISVSASSRQLLTNGRDPITISVVAKDENNNILPGANVNFSVDNDANIEVNQTTGSIHTALLTPNEPINRDLKVTISSGKISKTIQVKVIGTKLTIEGPASIAISKLTEYDLKLLDSSGIPVAYTDVIVTSKSGHTISPVDNSSFITDSAGHLKISFKAESGGLDEIIATAAGASFSKDIDISGNDFTLSSSQPDIILGTEKTITVKWLIDGSPKVGEVISVRSTRGTLNTSSVTTNAAGEAEFTVTSDTAGTATITAESSNGLITLLDKEFVADTPKYLSTQASPSLIAPKTSSRIVSRVRDANDNPVKNIKVNFNLTDTVDGTLSNSQAITDSLGRAEVVYTAGNSSSAYEGVKIVTELKDFPVITDPTNLTVGGNAVRIVLGGSAKIESSGDEVFYSKTYGVIVTDSAGNPIKDQQVDFTIAATSYNKGYMLAGASWYSVITAICPAEDFNHNGNRDEGEDINNNGALDPTQAATVTSTGTTDDEGKLSVKVVYPKSEAIWSTHRITATTFVAGTEHVEHVSYRLNLTVPDVSTDSLVPNVTILNEDRNANGIIDNFSEDFNNNGILDMGEDVNKNQQLDTVVSEDLNGNGVLDDSPNEAYFVGAYGSSTDCSNPN